MRRDGETVERAYRSSERDGSCVIRGKENVSLRIRKRLREHEGLHDCTEQQREKERNVQPTLRGMDQTGKDGEE